MKPGLGVIAALMAVALPARAWSQPPPKAEPAMHVAGGLVMPINVNSRTTSFVTTDGIFAVGGWLEAAVVLSPRMRIQIGMEIPGWYETTVRAPRYTEELRRRDIAITSLIGFRPQGTGRIRGTLVGGFGLVLARRVGTLGWKADPPVPGRTETLSNTEVQPSLIGGLGFDARLARNISLVVRLQGRWTALSSNQEFYGRGSFTLCPGVGLQVEF